jgi:RHS repeat-associated protein
VHLTAFVNPQAAPPTGEQTTNLWDRLKLGLSFELARPVSQQDNSVPVAYLKYICYDKDYKPLKDGYIAITAAALASPTTGGAGWEGLSFDMTASEDGYVQVLVANESDKAVWFDDLLIKHSPALIVQENHYDPWGLNLAGIEKQGQPDHKWKFLGREQQEELGLGWVDLQARMYDPQLGRFHAVDPLVELYQESFTPYHYSFNNPVLWSDPDGRWPDLPSLGEVVSAASDFAGGVVNAIASNNTTFEGPTETYSLVDRGSGGTAYTVGQAVGDAVSVVQGAAEFVAGATGAAGGTVGGVVTAPSGVGAVAGAVVTKAGVVVAGHGINTAKNALSNLLGDNKGRVNSDGTYSRVKPRKETLQKVTDKQPRNANGEMLDPNTGQVIDPNRKDLGHVPGQEWKTRKEMHKAKGSTRQEVIEAENDPNLYQWEDRSSNRSHKHEKKD